jgi:enterobactin synthetase component D / holo-[acyl-carrier protein] synthase
VFSAKETLYKAYFPLTGFFIGFRDAAIALVPEADDAGRFEARLLRRDAPSAAGQRRFAGRYRLDAQRILTGLAIDVSGAGGSA